MIKKHRKGFWDRYLGWIYWFPCPGCGELLEFHSNGEINVNCESDGSINIQKMLGIVTLCDDPLCPWSKLGSKYRDIGHVIIKGIGPI